MSLAYIVHAGWPGSRAAVFSQATRSVAAPARAGPLVCATGTAAGCTAGGRQRYMFLARATGLVHHMTRLNALQTRLNNLRLHYVHQSPGRLDHLDPIDCDMFAPTGYFRSPPTPQRFKRHPPAHAAGARPVLCPNYVVKVVDLDFFCGFGQTPVAVRERPLILPCDRRPSSPDTSRSAVQTPDGTAQNHASPGVSVLSNPRRRRACTYL